MIRFEEATIYGLGACISRAIQLALECETELGVNSKTITYSVPVSDEVDGQKERRITSAIAIKLYNKV